ncbi:unnamed protein product [Polarella glacialis]|uniref:Uncharacterized protein n=1 Tax=Polarella glacialis TaxID=89957 RepID=A0A813G4T3_POLGL|nr:unnamed protein product [Polarella glacialis]CAE8654736.1 unnamed protein product [Polarella glacialis]
MEGMMPSVSGSGTQAVKALRSTCEAEEAARFAEVPEAVDALQEEEKEKKVLTAELTAVSERCQKVLQHENGEETFSYQWTLTTDEGKQLDELTMGFTIAELMGIPEYEKEDKEDPLVSVQSRWDGSILLDNVKLIKEMVKTLTHATSKLGRQWNYEAEKHQKATGANFQLNRGIETAEQKSIQLKEEKARLEEEIALSREQMAQKREAVTWLKANIESTRKVLRAEEGRMCAFRAAYNVLDEAGRGGENEISEQESVECTWIRDQPRDGFGISKVLSCMAQQPNLELVDSMSPPGSPVLDNFNDCNDLAELQQLCQVYKVASLKDIERLKQLLTDTPARLKVLRQELRQLAEEGKRLQKEFCPKLKLFSDFKKEVKGVSDKKNDLISQLKSLADEEKNLQDSHKDLQRELAQNKRNISDLIKATEALLEDVRTQKDKGKQEVTLAAELLLKLLQAELALESAGVQVPQEAGVRGQNDDDDEAKPEECEKEGDNKEQSVPLWTCAEVFKACNVGDNGLLEPIELKFALRAFGMFFKPEEIQQGVLGKRKSLSLPYFEQAVSKFSAAAEVPKEVPYAWRGMFLQQLEVLNRGLSQGWMQQCCDEKNKESNTHPQEINLYSISSMIVQPSTDPETYEKVPLEVRSAAELPKPSRKSSFSELLNPEGVLVDFFVSHFWGHLYKRTLAALTSHVQASHQKMGKSCPLQVVYWICLFALNQHDAAEEVGSSPEQGPFNAAMVKATGGLVMILDEKIQPFERIWCLYEVHQVGVRHLDFEPIDESGPISSASRERLVEIADALFEVSAMSAKASVEEDRLAILYRMQDQFIRSQVDFSTWRDQLYPQIVKDETKHWHVFSECNTAVSGFLSTPLFVAALERKQTDLAIRYIGMGADVSPEQLRTLAESSADLSSATAETRYCDNRLPLAHIFSHTGATEALKFVLAARAAPNETEKDGVTAMHFAMHFAAGGRQLEAARILLDFRADPNLRTNDGQTPLHFAAMSGKGGAVELLLQSRAEPRLAPEDVQTALELSVAAGHSEVADQLRAALLSI